MDRWELYTAGKIPKPTVSPQLSRMEIHGDFVIEVMDHPPLEDGERDTSANSSAAITIPVEGSGPEAVTDGPCCEPASSGLAADPCKDSASGTECRHKRQSLWKETCDPGNLCGRSLQVAACGFIFGVAITLLVLFAIARTQ